MTLDPPRIPNQARNTLARGILVYRWVAFAWMLLIGATNADDFRFVPLAWGSVALAGVWTALLTVGGHRWETPALAVDLAICAWLLVVSGLVAPREAVIEGRPFFAAGYPISATLLWGVARGPMAGFASGTALSLALIASRPVNGVALTALGTQGLQNLAGGVVNYLVAGTAMGLVSEVLERSAAAVHRTNQELLKEREHTARLQERARLARQIHDSVLQTLAMVHKRGRELAGAGHDVAPEEVALLAETAGRQESELRSLILRSPEDPPSGRSSLRASLERVAQGIEGVPVEVSTVGSIWMEQEQVSELTAAVRQALENVVEHAHASRVSLFAEEVDSWVSVSVRDDGVGFVYDESVLQAKKQAGMLRSMKGRVEDPGGTMAVETGPGRGTEIELRVPCSNRVEP